MSDLKEKLKRQTEILGLSIGVKEPLERSDLELLFKCERPTINRDLKSLRENGVDIHSSKKGVQVFSQISPGTLGELILQYVGLNYSSFSYDKATSSLVRRQKERALRNIVMLQRGIDAGTLTIIDYEKEPGNVETGKTIAPWILFQAENEWRVLAANAGTTKQYLVCKMRNITPTKKTFTKPAQDSLQKIFEPAWGGWLGVGKESYQIHILFLKEAVKRYGHRQFVETQRYLKQKDGSAILEAKVNSLNEVAGWIVSHSTWVRALEPKELVAKVIELAEGAIKTHGTQ
jgi:predicted DNA-binding transcriptional regulator YafY